MSPYALGPSDAALVFAAGVVLKATILLGAAGVLALALRRVAPPGMDGCARGRARAPPPRGGAAGVDGARSRAIRIPDPALGDDHRPLHPQPFGGGSDPGLGHLVTVRFAERLTLE
ncbi:MAG: hypothetical protein M3434_09220, partial [Gemmatimonadota bacterium]|nr:hypothetical protein [Gemmatimonadota bacterium]